MAKKIGDGKKSMTPLWIIASFVSLTEIVAGLAATKTSGSVQYCLTGFACVFPLLIAAAFFAILWYKPYVFYPPTEFGSYQDVGKYVEAMQGRSKQVQALPPPQDKADVQSDSAEPPPQTRRGKLLLLHTELNEIAEPEAAESLAKSPDDLEREMETAFFEGKGKEGEELFKKLMEAEKDTLKSKKHTAYYYFLRFMFTQDNQALQQLANLTSASGVEALAFAYIGAAHHRLKEFDKAAQAYEASLEVSAQNERAGRFVQLALCYAKDGRTPLAIQRLTSALAEFNDPSDLAAVYEGLAKVYESSGNQEFRALALEKAVEAEPSNTSLRFEAAWAYSHHGLRDLALFHYSTLVQFESDAGGTLNNLGVEFGHFNLPMKSVLSYKAAFDQENTLAAANLAYLYMEGGFFKEAREILEKAKTQTDVHPNVGGALAALAQREEAEVEKAKSLLEAAHCEQKFLRQFADAYFVQLPDGTDPVFKGTWQSADGQKFELNHEGNQLSATWIHAGNKRELSGDVSNRGAKIRVKLTLENGTDIQRILAGTKESNGYACLTKDGRTLSWLLFAEKQPSFETFLRVP